jgi:dipeptidyl aminopeptidase/acylaminoacyl peptidase
MTDMGYPRLTDDGAEYWKPYSLKQNADRINTPLLMQSADTEYLASLETFMALREAGKPVELIVYPDEYHEKWQPDHRYAVYTRNIDWFSFWLMGREDPDPAKTKQYVRWREMRGRWKNSLGVSPVRQ